MAIARSQYADKHARDKWAHEIAWQRTAEFLDRARLASHGALVLKLLSTGPQPRAKINRLLLDKLPGTIAGDMRRRAYVKNLLQELARSGEIENIGGATNAARWALARWASGRPGPS